MSHRCIIFASYKTYNMKIAFVKMNKDAKTPTMATDGSAAYDLFADVSMTIPKGRCVIPTGIAIELPRGYVADVRPRSGYSLKGFCDAQEVRHDCDVLLGTIDSDYRGEINVIVNNHDTPFSIAKGQRIAQLLIHRYENVEFCEVDAFGSVTQRGNNGFGSTGN